MDEDLIALFIVNDLVKLKNARSSDNIGLTRSAAANPRSGEALNRSRTKKTGKA